MPRGEDAARSSQREGLAMVSDTSVIDQSIAAIFAANANELERYRGGEEKLFGFFMGQVMRRDEGQGGPGSGEGSGWKS